VAGQKSPIVTEAAQVYNPDVLRLTRAERTAIGIALTLLLVGWAVKTWPVTNLPTTPVSAEVVDR
jgi:hypothetical protein